MFISASKDNTAKLYDMETLENKKTYKTERPVNSATISPNKDHVILGGGQVNWIKILVVHIILWVSNYDEFLLVITFWEIYREITCSL